MQNIENVLLHTFKKQGRFYVHRGAPDSLFRRPSFGSRY